MPAYAASDAVSRWAFWPEEALLNRRPSLRELLGVWLAGVAAQTSGWLLVDDAGAIAVGVAVGLVFTLTPLFLVVYSAVWAWPLTAAGDRTALSALGLFGVVVQVLTGWFWVGVHDVTLNTIGMRLLSIVNPMVFAIVGAAAWTYRRRTTMPSAASTDPPSASIPAGHSALRGASVERARIEAASR